MLGGIIGGAAGALGGIFGGISKNRMLKQQMKLVNEQKRETQNKFSHLYHLYYVTINRDFEFLSVTLYYV